MIPLEDYLARFHKKEYPLKVLLSRPLPEYVNPSMLEMYLSSDEFVKTLGMTKEEWKKVPAWKQRNLRKEYGLF
jgi:supervillin